MTNVLAGDGRNTDIIKYRGIFGCSTCTDAKNNFRRFGFFLNKKRLLKPGAGAEAALLSRSKPSFCEQTLNFFGQKPAAKNEKYVFVFIEREKTEFVPSSKTKCPKSGF